LNLAWRCIRQVYDVMRNILCRPMDGWSFRRLGMWCWGRKFWKAHLFGSLKSDSEEELCLGCANFTRLSTTLKLFSLKAWSKNCVYKTSKNSFLKIIFIVDWKKHLMEVLRMKLWRNPAMVKKYTIRWKTLILCSKNIKRRRPQRKTFGRNDQSSLIFHSGVNLRYDII